MVSTQFREALSNSQGSVALDELRCVLDEVDASSLIARLEEYRPVGRKGYPLTALWRAYFTSFILGLPSTNALIRRLQDDPELRLLCGFGQLPHRDHTSTGSSIGWPTTAISSEDCLAALTDRLAELLPGLGQKVAADSTVVRSHSNPNCKEVSDPEASWARKNSTKAKGGKEWYWGYKYHLMADATYGIPLDPTSTILSGASIILAGLTPRLPDDSVPHWSCSSARRTPGSQSDARSCLLPPRSPLGLRTPSPTH